MSHRLFAQLAFERALGSAAIKSLKDALTEKANFAAQNNWPKPDPFAGQYDVDALTAELDQIVQDRIRDVLEGPGLQIIDRGELFAEPEIVALVQAAKAKRDKPG